MYTWLNKDGRTVLETESDGLSTSSAFLMMGAPTDEAVRAILKLAEADLTAEQEKTIPDIVAVQIAGDSIFLKDAFARASQDAMLAEFAGPGSAAEQRQKLQIMAKRFPQSLPS